MVEPVAVANGEFGIFGFFEWFCIIFVIVLSLASSIEIGINAHQGIGGDVIVGLSDLGNKFLLTTQNLNNISLNIISSGVKYDGFFNFLDFLGTIFDSFLSIFVWLWLLQKIYSWKNNTSKGKNYLYAILTFLVLQSFILLVNAGINGNLTSYFAGDNSAIYYISIPFVMFWNICRAIGVILNPIIGTYGK